MLLNALDALFGVSHLVNEFKTILTFLLKYHMFLRLELSYDKVIIFQWLHIEVV